MSEDQTIHDTASPLTRRTLAAEFRALGVKPGDLLLLHCSMRSLGWVAGGAQAVLLALLDALGPRGTLVVPTHSTDNSEPSYWEAPPVPEAWWPTIRDTMPAFDPARTPTRMMGRIPELFRTWPGVLRSNQPQFSFAAHGPLASAITQNHSLAFGLGEDSPLARIYDNHGKVLLLGVTHSNNTSLHLAEDRLRPRATNTQGAAIVNEDGQRAWQTFLMPKPRDEHFAQIGIDYEASIDYQPGKVGASTARLLDQRPLVDYGLRWLEGLLASQADDAV